MRNPDPLENLGWKLRRRGLPGGYVCRTLRELAEHREDLHAEAKAQGLTGEAGAHFVAERLGNLDELALRLTHTMRRTNWYGRHPVLAFCVLPLMAFMMAFFVAVWMAGSIGELAGWWNPRSSLDADGWSGVAAAVHLFRWGLFTAIPFWFCWLARRSYCGHKWAFATCLLFSLHGMVHSMNFVAPTTGGKGALSWGYGSHLDLAGLLIPLVVFGLFWMLCRHVDARETAQEKVSA